jgi:hypothetical protein
MKKLVVGFVTFAAALLAASSGFTADPIKPGTPAVKVETPPKPANGVNPVVKPDTPKADTVVKPNTPAKTDTPAKATDVKKDDTVKKPENVNKAVIAEKPTTAAKTGKSGEHKAMAMTKKPVKKSVKAKRHRKRHARHSRHRRYHKRHHAHHYARHHARHHYRHKKRHHKEHAVTVSTKSSKPVEPKPEMKPAPTKKDSK